MMREGGLVERRALHSCMMTKAQAFSLALIVVACACVRAVGGEIVTREVEYEHDGTVLLGYFAAPADASAERPVPGVIVVHEWWGHDDFARERAERIAGRERARGGRDQRVHSNRATLVTLAVRQPVAILRPVTTRKEIASCRTSCTGSE
mgnify:CR=1 FL=1